VDDGETPSPSLTFLLLVLHRDADLLRELLPLRDIVLDARAQLGRIARRGACIILY